MTELDDFENKAQDLAYKLIEVCEEDNAVPPLVLAATGVMWVHSIAHIAQTEAQVNELVEELRNFALTSFGYKTDGMVMQ